MSNYDEIRVPCPTPDCSNTERIQTKGTKAPHLRTFDLEEAPMAALAHAAQEYGPIVCSDCDTTFDLEADVTPRVVSEAEPDTPVPTETIGVNFTDDINRLLEEYEVQQTDLADAIGVSDQAVSDYVHGRRIPGPETAIRIADYFNLDGTSRAWDWMAHQLYNIFQNAQQTVDS